MGIVAAEVKAGRVNVREAECALADQEPGGRIVNSDCCLEGYFVPERANPVGLAADDGDVVSSAGRFLSMHTPTHGGAIHKVKDQIFAGVPFQREDVVIIICCAGEA